MNPSVQRHFGPVAFTALRLPDRVESWVSVRAPDPAGVEARIERFARERGAEPLHRFVFAGGHRPRAAPASPAVGSGWLVGDGARGGRGFAAQAMTVSGAVLRPIERAGRRVGCVIEDGAARTCRLWGVLPADPARSRADQTRSVLDSVQAALESRGFRMKDLVRTWFYLAGILDWYDEFNRVRTGRYREAGVLDGRIPASTGIGAAHASGAAVVCDALAVRPRAGGSARIRAVPSPLQESATEYRSSFSRAVEVEMPAHRSLLVSGTASIDRAGRTMYRNSPEKQIERTLRVVEALLRSRGMGWADAVRAIVYLRDPGRIGLYRRTAARLGLPRLPAIAVCADVCRRDLAFEIELDAVRVRETGP